MGYTKKAEAIKRILRKRIETKIIQSVKTATLFVRAPRLCARQTRVIGIKGKSEKGAVKYESN